MNKRIINSKRDKIYINYIITGFILIVFVLLIIVENLGSKQDELLLNDFTMFEEASALIESGSSTEALQTLENLNTKYSGDFNISHRLGIAYLSSEQYKPALTMFTRTLDLNPYLVENTDYLYQYALTLANNEQFDNSILVIDKLLSYQLEEELKSKVVKLREEINNLKGSTS